MVRLGQDRAVCPDGLLQFVEDWLQLHGIDGTQGVVVAVSGGLDSMVLLDLLQNVPQLREALHVAHFDHQMRPESTGDADFVIQQAARFGIPAITDSGDVARHARDTHLSVEMAARDLRYQFLERVRSGTGAEFVALGHHADDQAETVLMRMLRGSGSGLGGMAPVRGHRYLRPLLGCSRSVLAAYAVKNELSYRDDASNCDPRFLRNRVRHELLPNLHAYNPNIVHTLVRSAELLRDEDDWLKRSVERVLQIAVVRFDTNRVILAAQTLVNYHIAIQRRVLRHSVLSISRSRRPLGRTSVDILLDVAQGCFSGMADVGSNVFAQLIGDSLVLSAGPAKPVHRRIKPPESVGLPERSLHLHAHLVPGWCWPQLAPRLGTWEAAFDADSLGTGSLQLRGVREGDRMQPFGLRGRHKKLSDLLIDAQHPRLLRDELLLLTNGDEILWLAGLRSCYGHRVTASTKHILHCAFTPFHVESPRV